MIEAGDGIKIFDRGESGSPTLSLHASAELDFPQRTDAPGNVIATYVTSTNATLRMLLACNWGPVLMNLGYFPYTGPFRPLNSIANLMEAQVRLVTKAVRLLDVRRDQKVVDIACGRGKSTFMLSQMHREVQQVVGLDLNPTSIQVAKTIFGDTSERQFLVGDAAALPFPDGSFDRAISIEAAFHFPDRAKFMWEAGRVLRPGGKLVVVDFVWNDAESREHRNEDLVRIVRDIWGWEDFFTAAEYQQSARAAGLRPTRVIDWTYRVTHALQKVFERVIWLGSTRLGRRIITGWYPQLLGLNDADWEEVAISARAHRRSCQLSRYHAMVFEKPT